MGVSPFAKTGSSSPAKANRRRSTRIDYETPVILSGRDASGQTFREQTTTLVVNLHGAKVRTTRQVLVGMLVTVESVRTGKTAKAVCVNTYEPEAGKPFHEIALQCVQPGNLWGVPNPPADWAEVEAELGGQGQGPQAARASVIPFKPAAAPAPPPPLPATALPVAPGSLVPVEAQLAEFEERAARMMESLLEALRVQTSVTVRDFLAAGEERLTRLASDAETRVRERTGQALTELKANLETLRTEAMGEMMQNALLEFQQRLSEQSSALEGEIAERARLVSVRAEERLAQAASRSEALADSKWMELEQRMRALATETENRIRQQIEQVMSDKGPVIPAMQERAEALSARLETRLTQNTSKTLTEFDAALATFRNRLGELTAKADAQFSERTEKAFADFEASLASFRSDLEDELTVRREEAVQAVEQALRSRLAAMLSGLTGASPESRPAPTPKEAGNK